MRTLVDIPDRQIRDLAAICRSEKISRAELIRQAIAVYLQQKKPTTVDAFGVWKEGGLDGLAYQEQVRTESVSALFDTNILIDYLNGIEQAKTELERYADKAISLVTWMEVMVGATPETEGIIRGFLSGFVNLPIDEQIAVTAVALRKKHKIKLPDAIVWASAQVDKRLFVTRNTKDFSPEEPGVRIPYHL